MDWLTTLPIAHRGLHNKAQGIIENSASAFQEAVTAGYAIELDIRLSKDNEAIVFHDAKLDRVTDQVGLVANTTSKDLSLTPLSGSTDRIQPLAEVLEHVAGQVPLLIEIKSMGEIGPLESRTADLLASYQGEFAVQSFNPYSMGWFAEKCPTILRGQISGSFIGDLEIELSWAKRFVLRNLLLQRVSRPNFISYEVSELPTLATSLTNRRGLPLLAWTVKTDEDLAQAKKHADNIIFENLRPAVKPS